MSLSCNKLFRRISLLLILTTLFSFVLSSQISTEEELQNFMKEALKKFHQRDTGYKKGTGNDGISYQLTKDKPLQVQIENDIVMIYKTFYPESKEGAQFFSKEDFYGKPLAEKNSKIIRSFKTLLFSIIDAGLYYSNEENFILNANPEDKFLWTYPHASAICHGGRTVFLYDKSKIQDKQIKEYFFDNDANLLFQRRTASHKVCFSKNKILEQKIVFEAALDWVKSVVTEDSSPHFGMNIPIGGIGNYWSDGETMISTHGLGKKGPNKEKNDKDPLQSGHLYVRMDSLPESQYNSIMIGLEEEAPDYKGMFSSKVHNFLNALKTPSTSVCGGAKWKQLGEYLGSKIPNQVGGKVVFLKNLPDQNLFEKIENFEEDLAKKIWWIMLSCNSYQYKVFKKFILNSSDDNIRFSLKYSERDFE